MRATDGILLEEVHSEELGVHTWGGTYADLAQLIDDAVRVVGDVPEGDSPQVRIVLTRERGETTMQSTSQLEKALATSTQGELRMIDIHIGSPSDAELRVYLRVRATFGTAISGGVSGASATLVKGAAAVVQARLEQRRRWVLPSAWMAAGLGLCVLFLAAVAVVVAMSSDSPALLPLLAASGVCWLAAILGLTLRAMQPNLVLVAVEDAPVWERWGPRIAGGVWSISLVVLGAVMAKLL